jgi:hypothetical protein
VYWESLTELAEKFQLLRLDLDINLPAMKEGFHANWYQPSVRERHECWRIEVPLFLDGLSVGRLQVVGDQPGQMGSACDAVSRFTELLLPIEGFQQLAYKPATYDAGLDELAHNKSIAGRQVVEDEALHAAIPGV